MMNYILVGHGTTGIAMKNAVEMIFGKSPTFYSLSFKPGEGLSSLSEKIEKTINDNDLSSDSTLVVTDLFCGTPYNASATLAMKGKVKDVITGMSLPICLELAQAADKSTVSDAVKRIIQQSPTYTRAFSRELQKQQDEGDFQ
jgi:PTS system sorbose-specific IIA component